MAAAIKRAYLFAIPSMLLIAFGYSYHYAEILGLPRPVYPVDLRSIAGTLYEVVTMRPLQTLAETVLAPVLAYWFLLAAAITYRSYKQKASIPAIVFGAGITCVAAGALVLYGYVITFFFAAFAGAECANNVRFGTGHDETYCGWVQHPGPIYLILRGGAARGLRFQRDFLAADRHGMLRRVGETDTEFFLIAVPALSLSAASRRYAPVWRISKADVQFVSEQLPLSTLSPRPLPSRGR